MKTLQLVRAFPPAILLALALAGGPSSAQVISGGGPQRIQLLGALTLFVDGSTGNDNNNGLVAGSAFATITRAATVASNNYDTRGNNVTIQLAVGQTWTNQNIAGGLLGGGAIILDGGNGTITGNAGNGLLISGSLGSDITQSSTFLIIQNVTFTCSNSGNGLVALNGIVGTAAGITFGSCPGGTHKISDGGLSRLSANNSYTISGGALRHMQATAGGHVDDNQAITVTLTGTPAFSGAFALADQLGKVTGLGVTYSGAATGIRYQAGNNSSITTGASGPNYFPGNAAGFVTSGGRYDAPGTPAVTACGTTPGSPSGTDQSGIVQEGTTATGCTITFTTQNQPKACTVGTNNATIQAGLTLSISATQLILAHPSVSSAFVFWICQ